MPGTSHRPEIGVRRKDVSDLPRVVRRTPHPVLERLERAESISLGCGEIAVGNPEDLVREVRREGAEAA